MQTSFYCCFQFAIGDLEGKVGEDSQEGLSGIIPSRGKCLSVNLEVHRLPSPAFLSSLSFRHYFLSSVFNIAGRCEAAFKGFFFSSLVHMVPTGLVLCLASL